MVSERLMRSKYVLRKNAGRKRPTIKAADCVVILNPRLNKVSHELGGEGAR